MKSTQKIAIIYALALILSISLAIQFASAREYNDDYSSTALTEEQLDNVLAPIALYPDTLLTHVLIASTYPMDVIRAARWRENNDSLSEDQIRRRVDVFDWDPSVKALAPFDRVLAQMSEDIDWLNYLGDAVIADEEWVMSRIQVLRDIAYRKGNLHSNEYVNVEREDNVVVIETVRDRVVYVPYYDTRMIYGDWWHVRSPYYWHHPRHYRLSAGFYWSPSIHIASHFFFGGFHWHHGYVVVNHSSRPYYRDYKRVYSREYKRWSHNTQHRHARYSTRVIQQRVVRQQEPVKVVRNWEVNVTRYGEYQRPTSINLEQRARNVKTVKSPGHVVTKTTPSRNRDVVKPSPQKVQRATTERYKDRSVPSPSRDVIKPSVPVQTREKIPAPSREVKPKRSYTPPPSAKTSKPVKTYRPEPKPRPSNTVKRNSRETSTK
ncbi:DUF3300 domain-containing protein [Alteromonas facilis]|uniref:DUF3300 domain-containing protein n=1 Tax=Alteromonas facilis TaxID=2048004 RepID=UPI000C291763|nr:DUF3300 domain-containing protein [Alteromonas facilis]